MMNIFAISGLLIFVTSFLMAGFMFFTFHESKNKIHFLWGVFCISVAIWGGGGYKIATTQDIILADAWWRITHIGIIFIPILFTHFVYAFLNIKRKKFIFFLYALGLFFLAANFTGNLFIANMRWTFNQFYYDSPPGIFYVPFTLMFFGVVLYTHIALWLACKKAEGLQKSQIKYFLVGMGVSFFGGSLSFLPVYKLDIYPVLNLFVCLYPIIIGYTITRYHLMDIRIAVRKAVVYFMAAVFLYGFFYFSVWLLTHLFGSVYDHGALLLGIFIAICFAVLFFLFEKLINYTANKYLFGILYSQHETLRELSQRLTTIIDFKTLISDIMDVVKETLAVDRIAVALKIDDDGFKLIKCEGFKKNEMNFLLKNEELKEYFHGNTKPLTIEELDVKKCGILKNDIIKSQADFLLPLISKNKLQGVIILGKKNSGDGFSQEDLSLLETLSHQAALAIENAKLYDKLEEWNDKLKEKVDEQTKDIRGKNVRLTKLLDLRTEFLHVASHQLRTPVSAIKGLVSMLKDGDFEDETPEVKQNAFNGIFKKTQKMTNILDDILAAAELDTDENFKLTKNTLGPVDIMKITENVMEEVREEAEGKNISLKLKVKSQKLGEEGNLEIKKLEIEKLGNGSAQERNLEIKKLEIEKFGKGSAQEGNLEIKKLEIEKLGENPENLKSEIKNQKSIMVLSNEGDLRHILINLLNNAVTYTEKGGKVEIEISIKQENIKTIKQGNAQERNLEIEKLEIEKFGKGSAQEGKLEIKKLEIGKFTVSDAVSARDCGGEYIIWSVRDNGIGIPKKSQKYLFEKFRRGKNANSMNCDGTGLGLFIVKKLVDAHPGGEVGFTSKEGEGSEFWVCLKKALKQ